MTPPAETALPETIVRKVSTKKIRRAETDQTPLVPLSLNIPKETLKCIIAEAKRNYPITPSQIARRILVAYYERQAALKKS